MHLAVGLVCIVAVATAVAALARRAHVSEPLLLTFVGVIGSYVPFIPDVTLTPEIVLIGLLPPLLYSASIRTSLVDFKANVRAIAALSVGLVVFSSFVVGIVAWWLLPVPFATAVALGAVVAPPDAVAATAVARRIGMPRRIVTILEGESLLNDATAIVTLRTAIAAAAGSVSILHVAGNFLWAAAGGAATGIVVALLLGKLRRHITDPVLDTSLSFLAPFAAYLPAEELHASGVLAVVTAGLILGHKAPRWQNAASRISERTNWRTIDFILESSVFLLIGLQIRTIAEDAWRTDLDHGTLVIACLGVLLATMIARPVWVFPATYGQRLIPAVRRADPRPPWQVLAVVSWAGMRGAVTLAAAFVLPESTPLRAVLVLIAFVVVVGSLVVQGTSLPWLVTRLKLRGPSPAEDALQAAGLIQQATVAGLVVLDGHDTTDVPPSVVDNLRTRLDSRSRAMWERLGPSEQNVMTPSEHYRRLRLSMLEAERAEVLKVRDSGALDHEVLQLVLGLLDLEESTIDRFDEADEELRQSEPLTAGVALHACEHLRDAPITCVPDNPRACQECLDEGLVWVHLRMCLSCGHVACCDSSPANHATGHFRSTGHPVMRSFEPGEAWRWCYRDSLLG